MKDFLSRLKIPTILGLGVIVSGIAAGVFLTLKEQTIISQASPDITPQNITVSNLSDDSATISWQTSVAVPSFLTYGVTSPSEQTVLDERDTTTTKSHLVHYFTLKNLLPKTSYQYKIVSGKSFSETGNFTTAGPLSDQTGFRPIIGSVVEGNKPLDEGIAYLSIADAAIQSSLIKSSGNFLIPISQIRKSDLSQTFNLTGDTIVKLTIVSANQQTNALFRLKDAYEQLPPITAGQDLDLTTLIPTPSPLENDFAKFDLNGDGKINAADNSIVLQNFGKNPKEKRADLNSDGVVDQKDLDLISKKIGE